MQDLGLWDQAWPAGVCVSEMDTRQPALQCGKMLTGLSCYQEAGTTTRVRKHGWVTL